MQFDRMGAMQSLLTGFLMLVLGGGLVWFWKDASLQATNPDKLPSEREQEFILLQAENRMLQSMLGQVDGKVMLLGPTDSGRKGYGKVVWDESLQSGYFYATQLPAPSPSEVYQLSLGIRGKPLVKCCTFSPDPDGRAQMPFSPSVRLLGVTDYVVTLEKGSGVNPPKGDRVLEAKEAKAR